MAEFLFITPPLHDPPVGGRELLSRLHLDCLAELLGDRFGVHELGRSGPRPSLMQTLKGNIDGVSPEAAAHLLRRIDHEGVGRVYLNGSNLGRLARTIKVIRPAVEVMTFFHNVEARFFLGALRTSKNPRAVAVLIANHAAERDAVRFSDRLIALNVRDSDGLSRLYGRAATDMVPMALEDRLDPARLPLPNDTSGRNLLFVGGAFYANIQGIRWFARKVAPRIGLPTHVIGRGLDRWRSEIERSGNVKVLGAVEDLQPHYLDAAAVIAPIFDGSGMKTKVAEALMFGKPVIGTAEAFRGYEEIASAAGSVCNSEEAFVTAVDRLAESETPRFDPRLRRLYESGFSHAATLSRLSNILGEGE